MQYDQKWQCSQLTDDSWGANDAQETVKCSEVSNVGHGITPVPERFRSNTLRVTLILDSATIALVDDRYGNHIEVLAVTATVGRLLVA